MSDPTAGLSHWLKHEPVVRHELVIAAWQAKGSVRRYLAGIGDERLRDIVRDLTPGEVADIAGSGTNPFLVASTASGASEASGYLSALEAEIRSLREDRKQLAGALAAEMLKNPC